MVAGREMDELVAEMVMGWTYRTFPSGSCPHIKHWRGPKGEAVLSPFSSDIKAAWPVVEKVKESTQQSFELCALWGGPYVARFDSGGKLHSRQQVSAMANTAPHAICLAALKAVGVEVA